MTGMVTALRIAALSAQVDAFDNIAARTIPLLGIQRSVTGFRNSR